MYGFAKFVTDFGDLAVTVPLAAATAAALFVLHRPRLALVWIATIAGCGAVTGGLKLGLDVCRHRFAIPGFASPSGHVAMAVAVYGGLALLIGTGRSAPQRHGLAAGAAALALAIAVTRLTLHAHTLAEAVAGLVIGAATVLWFRTVLAAHRPVVMPVRRLAAALLLLAAVFHGTNWRGERAVRELAGSALVRWLVPGCG